MGLRFKENMIFNVITILFFSSIVNIIISQNVLGSATSNETKNVLIKLEKLPFIEDEDNRLWVYSDNNKEKAQYRILYKNNNNGETNWLVLKDRNVRNEWSNYINSNEPYIVDFSNLQLKAGAYQICVQVKYISSKNKNCIDSSNQYSFKVLDNTKKETESNLSLDRKEYEQSETILIKNSNETESGMLYKLKLYNIETQEYVKEVYDYENIVKYDLKDVKTGRYIANLYYKNSESNNLCDGLNLMIIEIRKTEVSNKNENLIGALNNSTSSKRENAQLEYIMYVTKSKDTLSKIAYEKLSMFPIDKAIDIIKYENNITDINKLSIGQKLKIPYKNKENYIECTIKKKESLSDIVKKYIGNDAVNFYIKMILKENYIKSEEDIKVNTKIYIPKNFLNKSIN